MKNGGKMQLDIQCLNVHNKFLLNKNNNKNTYFLEKGEGSN